MNNKFLIRTVALKLLEKIYLSSDESLCATINAFDEWPVTITYKGIDWLEDCYNVNPCNYQ